MRRRLVFAWLSGGLWATLALIFAVQDHRSTSTLIMLAIGVTLAFVQAIEALTLTETPPR
jgi:hypothetical protein